MRKEENPTDYKIANKLILGNHHQLKGVFLGPPSAVMKLLLDTRLLLVFSFFFFTIQHHHQHSRQLLSGVHLFDLIDLRLKLRAMYMFIY